MGIVNEQHSLHLQYHDWGALEQGTEPPIAPRALEQWLPTAPGACSLLTAVCVHLDGLNEEDQFRVWVTILDNTSHYIIIIIIIKALTCMLWLNRFDWFLRRKGDSACAFIWGYLAPSSTPVQPGLGWHQRFHDWRLWRWGVIYILSKRINYIVSQFIELFKIATRTWQPVITMHFHWIDRAALTFFTSLWMSSCILNENSNTRPLFK